MKILSFLLALHLLLLVCAASAGEGMEVTIHSGWSFLNADHREPSFFGIRTTVESSPLFGVKAGYYLNDRFEAEGQFAIAPSHNVITDNSFVCPPGQVCPLFELPFFHRERNMVSYQYGGSFVYNFTRGDARPFASFGVGGVSSHVDDVTRTEFAMQAGGGVKFYFQKLGLRFEVIDQIIPDYSLTGRTEHDVQVQYGVMFSLH
jgi:outer membrane protein with beta-barrel domain